MSPQTTSAYRRKALTLFAFTAVLATACSFVMVAGTAQSLKKEREVGEKIPSHLPIKIKLKKPEKVKDLGNNEWLADLEVEVTNTGKKPIYFLTIALMLPDVTTEDGKVIVFDLTYGRLRLYEPEEPLLPDDVALLPGESTVLKVLANEARAWKIFRAKGKLSNPKKLELWFQLLKFGDGTGFWTLDGVRFPRKQGRNSNVSSGERKSTLAKAVTNSPPNGPLPTLPARRLEDRC